jgi:putative ABC transport system ATP-binding protein
MQETSSTVELSDVSLTLSGGAGPVNILRGVSLALASGEAVSVMGPSGSGKTSLLMVVSGLERATSGGVRVAGRDLSAMGEDELARFRLHHVGIVFQSFHLLPAMTALENVALPLELLGDRKARMMAAEALESVGLAGRQEHFPAELSGGEQQRVALARAFAAHPGLLLADEPTGNLDEATGATVMDLLFRLQKEHGTTLLLVTHDSRLADRCDRRLRMHGGIVSALE